MIRVFTHLLTLGYQLCVTHTHTPHSPQLGLNVSPQSDLLYSRGSSDMCRGLLAFCLRPQSRDLWLCPAFSASTLSLALS